MIPPFEEALEKLLETYLNSYSTERMIEIMEIKLHDLYEVAKLEAAQS